MKFFGFNSLFKYKIDDTCLVFNGNLEAVALKSDPRKMHLVNLLYDEYTDLFIDDHAFAFMTTNDSIEENDMTVFNFMPTNNLLNAIFK